MKIIINLNQEQTDALCNTFGYDANAETLSVFLQKVMTQYLTQTVVSYRIKNAVTSARQKTSNVVVVDIQTQ